MTVPNAKGGQLVFNKLSVANTEEINKLNKPGHTARFAEIQTSQGHNPAITVRTTYDPAAPSPPGVNEGWNMHQFVTPAIEFNGDVTVRSGAFTAENVKGNIEVRGKISAATVDIKAGGNFVVNTDGFYHVGGDPLQQWADQARADDVQGRHNADYQNTVAGTVPAGTAIGSIVADGNILINARTLNINGLVQSGRPARSATITDQAVGDEPVPRSGLETGLGQICLDAAGLFQAADLPQSLAYYAQTAGHYLTPLLFRVEGATYVLEVVGQSIPITRRGLNSAPFVALRGTVQPGRTYVFGFTDRQMAGGQGQAVSTAATFSGTVPFAADGGWRYTSAAAGTLSLGQAFSQDATGPTRLETGSRTYSAFLLLPGAAGLASAAAFSGLDVYQAAYEAQLAAGLGPNPLLVVTSDDGRGQGLRVWYNASTHQLQTEALEIRGGFIQMTGHVISTGNGKIRALDGYGQITVDNQTDVELLLNRLDTGGESGVQGKVVIVDASQTVVDASGKQVPLATTYAYDRTKAEVQITTNEPSDPGRGVPGRAAAYQPLADQRLYWVTGQKTLSQRTQVWDWEQKNYFWSKDIKRPSDATITKDETIPLNQVELLKGDYLGEPSRANPEAYQFWVTKVEDHSQARTTDYGVIVVSRDEWFWGLVVWTHFRQTIVTQQGFTYAYTHSVKADYPVAVEFSGSDSGLLRVTTPGSLVIDGGLVNRRGETTLRGDALRMTGSEPIRAEQLELRSQTGIGADAPLQTALDGGTLDASSAAGDVRIADGSEGGVKVALVAAQAGDLDLQARGDITGDPNPVLDRAAVETRKGQLALDLSSAFQGSAPPAGFAFYATNLNYFVTPLLFEVQGDRYVLAAAGASVQAAQWGENLCPLQIVRGSLRPDATYVFGFTDRQLRSDGGESLRSWGGTAGTIPYDATPGTSGWLHTVDLSDGPDALALDQVFSPAAGGLLLSGRTYSAQVQYASRSSGLVGGKIHLSSEFGSLGTLDEPLGIVSGTRAYRDGVAAEAQRDIYLRALDGDVLVNQLQSSHGDVALNALAGSVFNNLDTIRRTPQTVQERHDQWLSLGLTGDEALAEAIATFEASRTEQYQTYWLVYRQARFENGEWHVVPFDPQTYTFHYTDEQRAALRNQGVSDAEIARQEEQRTGVAKELHVQFGTLPGAHYDPEYRYQATDADRADLQGQHWTDRQLDLVVPLLAYAGQTVEGQPPIQLPANISGNRVTLTASGDVGVLVGEQRIQRSGPTTDQQRRALETASRGSITLTGDQLVVNLARDVRVSGIATISAGGQVNVNSEQTVSLLPSMLLDATTGSVYSATIEALNGAGDKTLTVTDVEHPVPGLTIQMTGTNQLLVSGVPTAAGTVTFNVTATDPQGHTATRKYSLTVQGWDFGDAPDSYRTSLAANGARHQAAGPWLGAERRGEPDARLPLEGLSDPDEDGVTFDSSLIPGQVASVTVTVGGTQAARLDGFVDFNANGSFADAGEHIFQSVLVQPGANPLTFSVPAGTPGAATFARFRISVGGGLGYDGPAPNGEVEDYPVRILPTDIRRLSSLTLGSTHLLPIAIGGVNPGHTGPATSDGYDQIIVNSSSAPRLDGTLKVQFLNGFVPPAGSVFEILKQAGQPAFQGSFASLSGLAYPGGRLLPIQGPKTFSLVASALPCDSLFVRADTQGMADALATLFSSGLGSVIVTGEIKVLDHVLRGTFTFSTVDLLGGRTGVAIAASGVTVTFPGLTSAILGADQGAGDFLITDQGLAGSLEVKVKLAPGLINHDVQFGGAQFRLAINTGTKAVNESILLAGGSQPFTAPAGPYVRIEAYDATFQAVGQTLSGSFFLEPAAQSNGEPAVRAAAVHVEAFLGSTQQDVGIHVTQGAGGILLTPSGIAAAFGGTAQVVGISDLSLAGRLNVLWNNTGSSQNEHFVMAGAKVDLVFPSADRVAQMRGSVTVAVTGFVEAAGNLAFERRVTPEGNGVLTTIKAAADHVSLYLGASAGAEGVPGVRISNGSFQLVLFHTTDAGHVRKDGYALAASGSAALVGVEGLTLAGSLAARVNRSGRPVPELGLDAADVMDLKGSGQLQVAGLVDVTGEFSFAKRADAVLGTTVEASLAHGQAFLGVRAGTPEALGVQLTDLALGLVFHVTAGRGPKAPAAGTSALVAGGHAALVGLESGGKKLVIEGDLAARWNNTGAAVDTQVGNVPIQFLDGSRVIEVSGSATLKLPDFVDAHGQWTFRKVTADSRTTLAAGLAHGSVTPAGGVGLELHDAQLGLIVYTGDVAGGPAAGTLALVAGGEAQLVGVSKDQLEFAGR